MIRTPKAREVLTQAELELYLNSLVRTVKKFSAAQLQTYITQSRSGRDKYGDLAKRQQGEARGKVAPRGTRSASGNERTVVKEQLFGEILARYEAALALAPARAAAKKARPPGSKQPVKKTAKKNRAKKRAAKSASAWKKAEGRPAEKRPADRQPMARKKVARKPVARKTVARKPTSARSERVGPTSPRRTAASKDARATRGGSQRKQGHTAARGRRSQASRDSRGGGR